MTDPDVEFEARWVEANRAELAGTMYDHTPDSKLCDHCFAGLHGDCAEAGCTCECNAPDEQRQR